MLARDYPLLRTGLLALALALPGTISAQLTRIYFVGNSVTDTIRYGGFEALAESNITPAPDHRWGRHMIPGAPLQWLWDNSDNGFTESPYGYPPNAFPNYGWEWVSFQPFDRSRESDRDYVSRYAGLLFGPADPAARTPSQVFNRDTTRILIYARWPRQDSATRPGGPRPYHELWLRTYTGGDNTNETKNFSELLSADVRTDYGANRVFMVPVGHVLYALHEKMRAGAVPGYTNIFQIYADGIHLNNVGSYIVAATYFAVVYGRTPEGTTVPAAFQQNLSVSTDQPITNALRDTIQQTIWEVVRGTPMTGQESSTLLITTNALPRGLSNRPYTLALGASGGVLPYTWTATTGVLPAGLSLSTSGVITGTPTVTGVFPLTLTVTDSTAGTPLSDQRAFTLNIDENSVPVITTTSLPAGARGSRYNLQLGSTGGNGQIRWSLASGTLPQGLAFGTGGVLVGSPVQEGTFPLTFRVEDADLPPDFDQRAFSLVIGPPEPTTIGVQRVSPHVRVDGKLDDPVWGGRLHLTNRALGGTPHTASFAAAWDDQALYVAVRVDDPNLRDDSVNAVDDDSVEIFLDAFNDKEAEFNLQHRQFRIDLAGLRTERGGRDSGVTHALTLQPGGYEVELRVPWSNLGITPAVDTVFGIDVAVNDDADGGTRDGHIAFAFADPVDPRPSQFGNAILRPVTAAGSGPVPGQSVAPAPLAYEPFDYGPAPLALHARNGGTGWGGAWNVQDGSTVIPGFNVAAGNLTFGALLNLGNSGTGGRAYTSSGRLLNVASNGPFAPLLTSGLVGSAGSELWLAAVLRKDANTNDQLSLLLHNNGIAWLEDTGGAGFRGVAIGYFGDESGTGSNRRWSVRVNTTVTQTNVPVVVGQPALLVARIRFAATTTVDLYVNPAEIGGTLPAVPTVTATTSASDMRFRSLRFYGGSGTGMGSVDEIRLGTSYASVTPVPADPVVPPSLSPLPGTSTSAVNVTLSTPTPEATIRYTLDGSEPHAGSALYAGPIALAATTTVRAKAFRTGYPDSVPTGGTYVVNTLTPAQQWMQDNGLPTDTDLDQDPSGSGVTHLERFAFGIGAGEPPKVQAPGGTSGLPRLTTGAGGAPVTEFVQRRGNGVTYVVELADNPAGPWTLIDVTALGAGAHSGPGWSLVVADLGGGLFRITLTDLGPGPIRLARVRVTLA